MTDILMRNKVLIDGRTLPGWGLSASWSDSPEPNYEEVPSIYDAFTRYVEINGEGEGTLEVTFMANVSDVNDPVSLFDALGMKSTYSYYDTTEEEMVHSSTHYDFSDDMSLTRPQIPIEERQIDQDATTVLDSDAASGNKVALRFKAMGDSLDTIKFMAQEAADGDVSGWDMEIWEDDGGDPDAKVVGSNTVSVSATGDAEPGDGALAWVEDSSDIMGTASLTVGDYYWLVLEATDTDPLTIGTYSKASSSFMDVQEYDGASWNQVSGSENPTMILQFTNTLGGHKVELYEYNQSLDKYILWSLDEAKVTNTGVEIESQKSIKVSLSIYSQNITVSKTV